jgi:hypothetical protein
VVGGRAPGGEEGGARSGDQAGAVSPAGRRGGNVFDPSRVRIEWTYGIYALAAEEWNSRPFELTPLRDQEGYQYPPCTILTVEHLWRERAQVADEPTAEQTYKLQLSGNGLSMDRQVTQAQAFSVVAAVMGGQQGVAGTGLPATGTGGSPPFAGPAGRPGVTIGEFVSEAGAGSQAEKIVTIAAYLMRNQGRETFTKDDVRGAFKDAGEPTPGNFHRDFQKAVADKKWIAKHQGSSSDFYVTNTGFKAVDAGFDGPKPPRKRARKASKAPAKKK